MENCVETGSSELRDNMYGESCRDGLFAKSSSLVFFSISPLETPQETPY
jgi:hypothetical protein